MRQCSEYFARELKHQKLTAARRWANKNLDSAWNKLDDWGREKLRFLTQIEDIKKLDYEMLVQYKAMVEAFENSTAYARFQEKEFAEMTSG